MRPGLLGSTAVRALSDPFPRDQEANLIDYQGGEFYGSHMRLLLFTRLREERRFDSLEALRAEVMRNREQTSAYFDALCAGQENQKKP